MAFLESAGSGAMSCTVPVLTRACAWAGVSRVKVPVTWTWSIGVPASLMLQLFTSQPGVMPAAAAAECGQTSPTIPMVPLLRRRGTICIPMSLETQESGFVELPLCSAAFDTAPAFAVLTWGRAGGGVAETCEDGKCCVIWKNTSQ